MLPVTSVAAQLLWARAFESSVFEEEQRENGSSALKLLNERLSANVIFKPVYSYIFLHTLHAHAEH